MYVHSYRCICKLFSFANLMNTNQMLLYSWRAPILKNFNIFTLCEKRNSVIPYGGNLVGKMLLNLADHKFAKASPAKFSHC